MGTTTVSNVIDIKHSKIYSQHCWTLDCGGQKNGHDADPRYFNQQKNEINSE